MAHLDRFALLDQINASTPTRPVMLGDWRVEPIRGGHNNLLFRARSDQEDLAIKLTRRDARDRAGREYLALSLLAERAPGLAPAPVLLERERWSQPVTVQVWLPGEPCTQAPGTPEDWQRLAEHYAAVHAAIRESACSLPELRPAVLTFSTARAAADFVLAELRQVAGLPEQVPLLKRVPLPEQGPHQAKGTVGLEGLSHVPGSLLALARRLEEANLPAWPEVERVFGRCDPNITNFIRRDKAWASVDWENSGWVDPAFELGDLMTHPCYASASETDWAAFFQYAASLYPHDPTFTLRVHTFSAVILVRWAGMFARYIYQRDSGSRDTTRLSPWPETWWQSLDGEYVRYVQLASRALNTYLGS